MRIVHTDEQEFLAETFARLFENECPPELVREFQDSSSLDTIEPLRRTLASTGLFGLALPEDVGGQGAGLFALGLAFEAAGAVNCPTVVLNSACYGYVLTALFPNVDTSRVRGFVDGTRTGSFALWNPSDASDVEPRLTASETGNEWTVSGSLEFVANADLVDELIVSAKTADGDTRLFIIATSAPGVHVERMKTFARDSQCVVSFAGAEVTEWVVASPRDVRRIANHVVALRCVGMIGGAQAVLDMSVAHLKDREQFDRPLASFQAAQHHVARTHIEIEGARLVAYQAVWLAEADVLTEREVSIAKLKCGRAFKNCTLTAHQLHGGIGYMREFDLHLWSERAKSDELIDGSAETQLELLEGWVGERRP